MTKHFKESDIYPEGTDFFKALYKKYKNRIACGGKGCKNIFEVKEGKTCKVCGMYICKECFNKSGLCKNHS